MNIKKKIDELTQDLGSRVHDVCEGLLAAPALDSNEISSLDIPNDRGIYIWRSKDTGNPVYIGVGLGKRGLRQRIITQHLAPGYRKSVFRKAVIKEYSVDPGEESVQYIRNQFTLGVYSDPEIDPAVVEHAEAILIRVLQPTFNKAKR